jgi:uncharacterized membrane protein (DUF485 family)
VKRWPGLSIASHPKYQELRAKRTSFGWWLTLAMMVVYYGFILLVAFNKPFLAPATGRRRHDRGHPARFRRHRVHGLITAIYVRRANSEFDELTEAISKAVLK